MKLDLVVDLLIGSVMISLVVDLFLAASHVSDPGQPL